MKFLNTATVPVSQLNSDPGGTTQREYLYATYFKEQSKITLPSGLCMTLANGIPVVNKKPYSLASFHPVRPLKNYSLPHITSASLCYANNKEFILSYLTP